MAGRLEIELAAGRVLTYDDVGDPGGTPLVYLHGTPDSRLARHPDDDLAAAAGVRLLAVDRPGYGGSSPARWAAGDRSAQDLSALLDHLGIERAALLAWSGGALPALWVAGAEALAPRIARLALVAGLVPRDAYSDRDVRLAGSQRLGLLELADSLPTGELAASVAPLLAPYPCDYDLALEHQADQRTAEDQAALAAIPGALEQMANALVEAVTHGLAGVLADIVAQIRPFGEALDRVEVPVQLWYGDADTVTPAAFGIWYAGRLPDAELHVIEGAGHYLPFTHWPTILESVAAPGAAPGTGPPG